MEEPGAGDVALHEMELRAGRTHWLRFINIVSASPARVLLTANGQPLAWRWIAKDGAALPEAQRREGPSTLRLLGAGETYDFQWTPTGPLRALLTIPLAEGDTLRQEIRVR